MSAIFMSHHRFSNINPEDIARFGNQRHSLNSLSFRHDDDNEDEDDENNADLSDGDNDAFAASDQDEEKRIGLQVPGEAFALKRQASTRRSVRSKSGDRKRSTLNRLHRKWKRIYRRYGFRHVIPVLLLSVYSILGALMFMAIEQPKDREIRLSNQIALANNRRRTIDDILESVPSIRNDTITNVELKRILIDFEKNHTCVLSLDEKISFDIWGSLFFVGTLYTTIGYGNIYPRTTAGWILTMVYAFFGVPLVLAILSDIGQLLCLWSNKGWRYLIDQMPKLNRRKSDTAENAPSDEASEEPDGGMPVTLALLLTFGWLFLCSGLFCIWETEWTFLKAFYFFFISLSTIGIGDVVPVRHELMVINFGFVIIGLCLVSMSIGVVQQHIELFLYRMMKMLQKECEALLANGDDVEKSELVKKVWEKQPWYVKRFMPTLVGNTDNKRLTDFAGSTITDTAVNMGIIPPPPGYRFPNGFPVNTPFPTASGGLSPTSLLPIAKPVKEKLSPAGMVAQVIATASAPLSIQALQPFQREQQRQTRTTEKVRAPKRTAAVTFEQMYPGGRVKVKRSESSPPSPDHRENLLLRALKSRTIMTQTTDEVLIPKLQKSATTSVQTDITGPDIIIKKETLSNLSLASWAEEEDTLPLPMRSMKEFASEDLMQFKDVAKMLTSTEPQRTFSEISSQTEAAEVSSDEDEYVSALETKAVRLVSKSVQTITQQPAYQNRRRGGLIISVETQTIPTISRNVEIQTSIAAGIDAETQCKPSNCNDEEVQTVPWQRLSIHQLRRRRAMQNLDNREFNDEDDTISDDQLYFYDAPSAAVAAHVQATAAAPAARPDILPDDEPFMDKYTQTSFVVGHREIEVQTVAKSMRNLEMQTDARAMENAETQTSTSRSSTPDKKHQHPQPRLNYDNATDDNVPLDSTWSYTSWVPDKRQHLDSVPEEENEEEELDDEELEDEQEEDINADLLDQNVFTTDEEDTRSEGGQYLPAITITPDDETTLDDGPMPTIAEERDGQDNDGENGNAMAGKTQTYGSVSVETGIQTDDVYISSVPPISIRRNSVACQTMRVRQTTKESDAMTAAIATQTEDLFLIRRNSFPRDIQGKRAEAVIRDYHNSKHRWTAWIGRRKTKDRDRPFPVSVGVQTEGYIGDGVRDIIVQTDDSYLKMARRLDVLKTARTKSLAIVVSPHLKQRLNRLAATSGSPTTGTTSGTGTSSKTVSPARLPTTSKK